MKHDFLDHHRSGNSPVHLADPRLKIVVMLLFIFAVVITPYREMSDFLCYAGILFIIALVSRVSLFHYLSKLLKLYPMIFLITFLLPFFPAINGAEYQIGFVKIYQSGLQKFALINIKSVLAILMSIVLTVTTDFSMLLKGVEKLRVPRLPIMVLSFMYRFIFLLIDETERMQMAYQSRYIKLPVLRRLQIFSQQIGVLFIRTYERGERVYQAMDSRGWSGEVRTLNDLHWRRTDTLHFALFALSMMVPVIFI